MFYYFGAKHRYANRYQRPQHRLIIEPFAGAAGYTVHHLARGNADAAILIDKDPRVVDLWQRLLAMTPTEVLALKPPPAGERTTDFLWMTAAASNAIGHSTGYSFTDRSAGRVHAMLRRIARILPYTAGRVTVIEGDYTDAPDVEATWFIDPPYQSVDGDGRGMGYAPTCDASTIDFAALGEWCRGRRGQAIVCEYEGAAWLPFVPLVRGQDSVGQRTFHEVAWNSTSDVDRLFD